MKPIGKILEKNDVVINNLLKKLQQHRYLSKIFKGMLDKSFAQNCYFANLKESTLTVTVPNASWATKIRYAIPDMIKILQTQPEFKKVTKIRYHIDNKEDISIPKKKIPRLSVDNNLLWQKTLDKLREKSTILK